ncbi:Multisubunit Na+/H+ antiporter MnhB subunit [Methanonatronarchaeum thermophilum]|uniref:Multisubunit Na+/H+ antiporter MnhB subunit n=1 Tax=Methanonatronarchaeum thermophilum TaxID=1927129 RepID=A0A1Y3GEF2_9EURY|nr:MnhB domain-containing protein [Methanonatronarchaeum thermophilum]OUJ18564.1 Multisubunit Na+/H+ antiporter MnhB subunit [Methanonatronarchaeum thermophilum]
MKEMSTIVKSITSLMYIPILVFGMYIIIHGHILPGGGFQGGVIVATGVALVFIAYGTNKANQWFSSKAMFSLMSLAAVLYFIVKNIGGKRLSEFLLETEIFGPAPVGINPGFIDSGGVLGPLNILVGILVFAAVSYAIIVLSQMEAE